MRGALILVSPPDALVERVHELAELLSTLVIEVDADEIDGPVDLQVDPLSELHVDGVSIALSSTVLRGT